MAGIPVVSGVAANTCMPMPSVGAEEESNTNSDKTKDESASNLGSLSESGVFSVGKTESKFTFILSSSSVKGISVKIRLRKGAKIKKAMKKFGKKFDISRKELKFVLGGEVLSGEELVSGLEGREIVVVGKLN